MSCYGFLCRRNLAIAFLKDSLAAREGGVYKNILIGFADTIRLLAERLIVLAGVLIVAADAVVAAGCRRNVYSSSGVIFCCHLITSTPLIFNALKTFVLRV